MKQSVEAVLLDMDGTQFITEPRNRRVHEVTALKYGARIEKSDWDVFAGTNDRFIWTKLKEKFNNFSIGVDDYIEEVEDGYLHDQQGVVMRPGIMDIFTHVSSRQILVATVTNAPHHIARNTLRLDNTDARMNLIVTKDDILANGMRTKPAADPFLYAAKILGVNIKNCIILEDSKNGAEAGIRALGSVNGHTGRLIQIIDPDDHAQYHPHAHAHVYDKDQLVAAAYKFIP